jgi:hypothetical protein
VWGMVTLVVKADSVSAMSALQRTDNTCEALAKHLCRPCTGLSRASCTDWHTQAFDHKQSSGVAFPGVGVQRQWQGKQHDCATGTDNATASWYLDMARAQQRRCH